MSFRTQVLTALKWTLIGRISTQVVSWVITILVMRTLAPEDYGLMAMATIFTGLFAIFAEIGLGSSLVQTDLVSDYKFRQAFGVVLMANVVIVLILAFAVAPLAGRFFSEDRVISLLQVVSLQFIPSAFTVIPGVLLDRRMEYRGRAAADFLATISGALLTLYMAYSGYGAWSLAWGSVLTSAVRAVALNVVSPFAKLPVFRLAGSGGMLRFGRDVAATQLVYYFLSQADALIVGRLLGQHMLGLYSVAMNLASMPASRVGAILNQVAFPAMSKVKREGGSVQPYVLKAVRWVGFVALPVMWGMASVSPELVRGLLGTKWEAAIPLMSLICLAMPLRMLGPVIHSALQSVGRADVSFRNTCLTAVVMCTAFTIGCQFGLIGVALAWVLAFPCVFAFNVARAAPHLQVGVRAFFAELVPSTLASAAMCGCVWMTRSMLSLNPVASLVPLVLIGAASYLIASWMINRQGMLELIALIRPAVAK